MKLHPAVRGFIEGQRVARMATVDEAARPHIVPVCFALVDDSLYSVIDEKPKRGDPARLRRLRNLAANSHVQILFDIYEDHDWSRLRFVQLRGRARILVEGGEYERALAALRHRYPQYQQMHLEGRPVIGIDADQVIMWPR